MLIVLFKIHLYLQRPMQGTLTLLQAAKIFGEMISKTNYHISTDEVYGSLGAKGFFTEKNKYDPHLYIQHQKHHLIILKGFHNTYRLLSK